MQNKILIFDMDGALIDSIPDIAYAMNKTRAEFGCKELSEKTIESYIGNGLRKLVERAFQDDDAIDLDAAVLRQRENYTRYSTRATSFFPGVEEGLSTLHKAGYLLGVFSNKPGRLCRRILEHLGALELFVEVLGAEDGYALKPEPEAVQYLLEKYNCDPKKSWFAGDHYTDLQCAENSGLKGCFFTYGYGNPRQVKMDCGADTFADFVAEVLSA